jgi:hypothetical protein
MAPEFKVRGNLELTLNESQLLLDLVLNLCDTSYVLCDEVPPRLQAVRHKIQLLHDQLVKDQLNREEWRKTHES